MGQAKIPMVSSLRALATLAVLLAVSWELGSATSEVDTTDVISDVAQLLSKNPNIQDDADDGSIAQIKQALSSEKASQEKVTNPKEDAVWTDETKEDTTNLDQNDAPEEDMLGDGDGADSVCRWWCWILAQTQTHIIQTQTQTSQSSTQTRHMGQTQTYKLPSQTYKLPS